MGRMLAVGRLAVLGALLAGCATLPSRLWPRHDERTVVVDYPVVDGRLLEVPVSGPELTILEFAADPLPLHEHFIAGRRFFELPAGCTSLTVHCRYRVYAPDDSAPLDPAAVFPGATVRLQDP